LRTAVICYDGGHRQRGLILLSPPPLLLFFVLAFRGTFR
jgi:hypothetical protein